MSKVIKNHFIDWFGGSRSLGLSLMIWVTVFFMVWVVFSHFNPGAVSHDSIYIYDQAKSGLFQDGHPPLMALIWRVVDRFVSGSTGILILNLAMFYGGLGLVFAWESRNSGICAIPALIIVGLYPPIVGILGVIWIDITMAAFFICGIGFCVWAVEKRHIKYIYSFFTTASFILIFFGLALRHNGAAAAFPLLVFAAALFLKRRLSPVSRFFCSSAIGVLVTVIFFLSAQLLSAKIVVEKRHFWRVGALYDIAGVSATLDKNLFNPTLFPYNSLEDIKTLYSPRSNTPLLVGTQVHSMPGSTILSAKPFDVFNIPVEEGKLIFDNWIRVAFDHPAAFLKHRFNVFYTMVTPSQWGLWGPVYNEVSVNGVSFPLRTLQDDKFFGWVKYLSSTSAIFNPYIYLIISFALMVPVLFFGFIRNNDQILLSGCLFSSGFAHMSGLFFLAGSSDFRYSHWLIVSCMLGVVILFLESYSHIRNTLTISKCI